MRSLVTLLLIVLTRDGVVHRLDGHHDTAAKVAGASAVTVVGKRTVVLAGGKLVVDGKAIAGSFADGLELAGGNAFLWMRTATSVVRVDLASGKRATVLELSRVHRIAADGDALFAEADGVIVEAGTDRKWKIAGHPIALAAGDGKLYVATKEGPLWEVDRADGKQRDLQLGDWWGTLALAYGDHGLYAVTVAGKLWHIDPQRREKTVVAMDGWQGAIDLAVLR
jgi:outer membrane protein assembly factor BamB